MFPYRGLHKCIVTKSLNGPTYLTCLSISMNIGKIHFYIFIATIIVKNILSMIPITQILIAFGRNTFPEDIRKVEIREGHTSYLIGSLVAE